MSKINLRRTIHSLYRYENFLKRCLRSSQMKMRTWRYLRLQWILFLIDCNNRLCVACTFSHIGQGNTYTLNSPCLIFTEADWAQQKVRIRNSWVFKTVSSVTHMKETHRQMTERNIHLTQEVISGLEKGERSTFSRWIREAVVLQYVWRKPITFRKGKKGKRNNFEMNCQVHQKTQEHLYNKYCKRSNYYLFMGSPSRNNFESKALKAIRSIVVMTEEY